MEPNASQQLGRLHELILQEREAARSLDMPRLTATVQQKEALIRELGAAGLEIDEEDGEIRELAERIRRENRRNAYLFWAGLNMVRDTMGFFSGQAPPPHYDAFGGTIQSSAGGRLLSGRI